MSLVTFVENIDYAISTNDGDLLVDTRYGWEKLQKVGDFVVCKGKTARQVSPLAKTYVERNLSPEALVTSVSTPDGNTVVFLAYVPARPESQPTRAEGHDSPYKMPTERQMEQQARRQAREAADIDKRNAAMDEGARGKAAIAKYVEGYEPWDGK